MSGVLSPPYDAVPLRCVEHHRVARLVGYCPSCVLRRIDEALQHPPGYGSAPGWQEAVLAQIQELLMQVREMQLRPTAQLDGVLSLATIAATSP